MEAAELGNELIAWPQCEVIGVAKEHSHAGPPKLLGQKALDSGLGTDSHEDRRFNRAVGQGQSASASQAIGAFDFKAERDSGLAHWTVTRRKER
jgi:hypothetical protein